MRHVTRWSCLALVLFAFGTPLQAQNKPNAKGDPASARDYQTVLAAGELTGKIARIDQTKRLITVQVEVRDTQADVKQAQAAAQQAAQQQQQMARQAIRKPGSNPAEQARQAQQQAAQAQRQQVQASKKADAKPRTLTKEFEFQADEKAHVRLMTLPQEYDERGKPKQRTTAELKELKGPNPSLPGYQADFEDLTAGQTVKLRVAAPKPAKTGTAVPPKNKAKDADLDGDKKAPVAVDASKHRATLVLILKDEADAKQAPKTKK